MKKFLILFMLGTLAILGSGCSSKHKSLESRNNIVTTAPAATSKANANTEVSTATNGILHSKIVINQASPGQCVANFKVYPKSGIYLSNAILQIAKLYGADVQISSYIPSSALDFVKHIRDKNIGAEYVVYANIINWEDHPTEWTGVTDKITIEIALYKVSDDSLAAQEIFTASSKWFTFGGDHPQDLLDVPLRQNLAKWFGVAPIKKGRVNLEDPVLRSTVD